MFNKLPNTQKLTYRQWLLLLISLVSIIGILAYASISIFNNKLSAVQPEVTSQQPSGTDDGACPQGRPPRNLNLGGESVRVCGEPTNGIVTAVTAGTLTVTDEQNNMKVFNIVKATSITEHGTPVDVSVIKPGITVSVLPADISADQAGHILINPHFGE
jgi:hypothetical protein